MLFGSHYVIMLATCNTVHGSRVPTDTCLRKQTIKIIQFLLKIQKQNLWDDSKTLSWKDLVSGKKKEKKKGKKHVLVCKVQKRNEVEFFDSVEWSYIRNGTQDCNGDHYA